MPQEEDFFQSEDPNNDPAHGQETAGDNNLDKGNSRRRLLLLVLLLLVIVAAAAFYLGPGLLDPEVAQTPAPPPKKKVVKLPPPKSPEKEQPVKKQQVLEKEVVEEKISEQPVAAQEQVSTPEKKPTAAPGQQEMSARQEETADTAETTEAAESVATETTEPAMGAAEEAGERAPEVAAEPVSEPVVSGRYVLQAGAYLMQANLEAVSRSVESLGYRPRFDEGTKTVEMTRLKVGTYDEKTAARKLQEVRRLAPDAFTLSKNGRVGVYAGSFYNLDRARVFADRLYSQGVRVEEEEVVVELPITIVRFGAFEERSEAENVAKRARDNGLEIAVVEKR